MNCGTALDEARRAPRPRRRRSRLPEERRQVTVLFADLSGYTAVAERMDPEAVKALVDRALHAPRRRRSSATAAPSTSTSATT